MNYKEYIAIAGAVALGALLAVSDGRSQTRPDSLPQNSVPCKAVPNGSYNTIQCANGYWRTITPNGEVFEGNGIDDPNASAQGSGITINPGTGGVNTNPSQGPSVTAPTQNLPYLAPNQAQQFGQYPPLE